MEYRDIAPMMGNLWSPLVAVTSHSQGKSNAQIAVGIGAASIVPSAPRVIIQIYKRNLSHGLIIESGAFALNFLREDQLDLIADFGLVSGRSVDKLAGVEYRLGTSGSPILDDCFGYLDCRVINAMDAGDMTCFLGQVLDGKTLNQGDLSWWRQAQRLLPAQVMEEWDRKILEENLAKNYSYRNLRWSCSGMIDL